MAEKEVQFGRARVRSYFCIKKIFKRLEYFSTKSICASKSTTKAETKAYTNTESESNVANVSIVSVHL